MSASDRLTKFLHVLLADPAISDMPLRQIGALDIACQKEGLSVRDLAPMIGAPRPSVTRALDGLEREGLIWRERTKEDGRLVAVVATAKGHKLRAQLAAALAA